LSLFVSVCHHQRGGRPAALKMPRAFQPSTARKFMIVLANGCFMETTRRNASTI
jgi:hypothetical protein